MVPIDILHCCDEVNPEEQDLLSGCSLTMKLKEQRENLGLLPGSLKGPFLVHDIKKNKIGSNKAKLEKANKIQHLTLEHYLDSNMIFKTAHLNDKGDKNRNAAILFNKNAIS